MFLPMLLAIIAATLFASSNHIDKYLISKAVKHSDYRALILVSTLISGGIMSVIYLFVCGFNISFDLVGILLMLSNAALTVFSLILWFKALDREDVAVVTIMLQLIPVFSLFIAPLLLADQAISPVQLVGSAIIVFAAIYITYEPSKQRIDMNRAFTLLLMVVASFMFAAQDVINRYVDQNHDFNRTILWLNLALLVTGIIIYVFIKPYRKSFNTMIKNNGAKVIGLNLANEVVYSFANTIQIFASTLAPVALVSFVTQSTIPFIVMLIGVFITKFFPKIEKEKIFKKEIIKRAITMLICVIGLACIGFG